MPTNDSTTARRLTALEEALPKVQTPDADVARRIALLEQAVGVGDRSNDDLLINISDRIGFVEAAMTERVDALTASLTRIAPTILRGALGGDFVTTPVSDDGSDDRLERLGIDGKGPVVVGGSTVNTTCAEARATIVLNNDSRYVLEITVDDLSDCNVEVRFSNGARRVVRRPSKAVPFGPVTIPVPPAVKMNAKRVVEIVGIGKGKRCIFGYGLGVVKPTATAYAVDRRVPLIEQSCGKTASSSPLPGGKKAGRYVITLDVEPASKCTVEIIFPQSVNRQVVAPGTSALVDFLAVKDDVVSFACTGRSKKDTCRFGYDILAI